MFPPRILLRSCCLFERQLLVTRRRLPVTRLSSAVKSTKVKSPIINTMQKSPNHVSGTGKEQRSWLIDEKVYRHLRNHVLHKPAFAVQVSNVTPSRKLEDVVAKCKEDLQKLNTIQDLHAVLSDVMSIIDHMDKDHVMCLLERECCLRLHSWSVKEVLLALDIFYLCQWRAARFYRTSFRWFDLKLADLMLEPRDITQLLFYIAMYRNAPITLMRQIEQLLVDQINGYSPVELGVICHAFFVTNTCILNYDLLCKLSSKLIEGLTTNIMPAALIGNYLKVFRHAYYEDLAFYQELGDCFLRLLPNLGTYANMQLFKTFSSLHFYHRNYCLAFVSHWEKLNLSKVSVRYKTLVDIVSSCIVFQIRPPVNVTDKLMDTVQHGYRELSNLYPEKFIEGLVALILTDRYPFEAISYALSSRVKKEGVVLEQLYQCQLIDESVEVLCPQYRGHRLPERWIAQFRNYKVNLIKQVEWRKGLRVLLETLQLLLGNCVKIDTVLLSSQVPVLLMNVDEDDAAIPLSDKEPIFFDDTLLSESLINKQGTLHSNKDEGELAPDCGSVFDEITGKYVSLYEPLFHHSPNEDSKKMPGRKLVVMVLGRNQFHKNVDMLHGLYVHIVKLMLMLGYEVIGISPWQAEQVEYMRASEVQQFVKTVILDKFGIKY